jgi:uncharacterized protein (UPF0212 family)
MLEEQQGAGISELCADLNGGGSTEEGDECEPELQPSFIEAHTAFKTVLRHVHMMQVDLSESTNRYACAQVSHKLHNTSRNLLQSSTC